MDASASVRRIAATGMFDGVHLGHRHLLRALAAEAEKRGLTPLALTFAEHPLATLRPGCAPAILTSQSLKKELIGKAGIDGCVIMPFGKEDFALTAAQFTEKIRNDYGVDVLLMGFNNHIGSDRRTAAELAAAGLPVVCADEYPGLSVSSSQIREAVGKADFTKVQALSGHRFTVRGTVGGGQHIGRTIGFPTANITPEDTHQLLPPDGVYAVDVHLAAATFRGMANIGMRPTVAGTKRTFEVNIIGFSGDIYGERADIDFISRLRDERRFESLDALAAQLAADRAAALAAE